MSLLEIYTEWKQLGFWNQTGIGVGIISVILTILALAGVHIVHLIEFSLLLLFCGFGLLVYGNIQQSKKLADANIKISKVDDKVAQATQGVYNQKNKEIAELEIEVATWKDKAANNQDNFNLLKEEHDKTEKQMEKMQNILQQEQKKVDSLEKAYVRMRTAYRKSVGMVERQISIGIKANVVKEGSPDQLQQMSKEDLYMNAEKLAREAKVPDDA